MRAEGFVDNAKYQGAIISQNLKVTFSNFEQTRTVPKNPNFFQCCLMHPAFLHLRQHWHWQKMA